MDSDGGADLVDGDLLDRISLFLQRLQRMVTEGKPFLPVISIANRKAVAFDSQTAFL